MNANSQPPTQISIKGWLAFAAHQLSDCGITSARLDAELILAHALGTNRTFLHAHPNDILNVPTTDSVNKNLGLRLKRTPIAYIIGYKEFYGREFLVSTTTLVPRPESEEIIESLKNLYDNGLLNPTDNLSLVDVGTGCGELGITAKLEYPILDVTLTDVSGEALKISRQNAKKLAANVRTTKSDLMVGCSGEPDIILADLPYVNPEWDRSPETNHEPDLALFAGNNGQEIIERLLTEASTKIKPGGFIIFESDPSQQASLIGFAKKCHFNKIHQSGYALTLQQTN